MSADSCTGTACRIVASSAPFLAGAAAFRQLDDLNHEYLQSLSDPHDLRLSMCCIISQNGGSKDALEEYFSLTRQLERDNPASVVAQAQQAMMDKYGML